MGKREAQRGPPGRECQSPSVPGGGWTGPGSCSAAQGCLPSSRLGSLTTPPSLLSPPPPSSLPALPLQLCLAGPSFTRPQNQRGSAAADSILRPRHWGQDPSGSGPASRGSSRCLPSSKSPVLLWFCCPLRPAPHSALTSLSPLSCPPRLLIPALPLASGLQPLLLLGFPTRRCQALPLSWYSVRFPPPQPLSSPLSTLSSPAAPSEAQVQGNRCFLPARPSLRGWQVRAWRPPYSCPRLPGGHWEIKKRAVCVKDCRITAEKVLTWGQPQAKPFYNQSGNQAGPRRVRNKWAQRGGGEAGSPGK